MLKSSHIEELLKLNLTQNFIFQNTTPGLLLFDSSYVVIFHLCEFPTSPKMRISRGLPVPILGSFKNMKEASEKQGDNRGSSLYKNMILEKN